MVLQSLDILLVQEVHLYKFQNFCSEKFGKKLLDYYTYNIVIYKIANMATMSYMEIYVM